MTPEERFWSKVDSSGGIDACWPYTEHRNSRGYGQFWYAGKSRIASRMAYIFTHGSVSDELEVCHSCDNPPCCNPSHLWIGTGLQNIDDCRQKGRLNRPKGSRHGHAILSELQVQEIRQLLSTGGISQREIARRYGVHFAVISAIRKGAIWRHVTSDITKREGYSLTVTEADNIRELYSSGAYRMRDLAEQFGVSAQTICNIVNRKLKVRS